MKRRKFIGIVSVGTATVIAGSYISFSGFDTAIKKILTNYTKMLKLNISDKEISSFIIGANKAKLWESYSFLKKELIKWHANIENIGFSLPSIDQYKWYKQEIERQFLFSTSFFYNGMDTTKPVYYLRIYNPYNTPCCNPFSNTYYS